MMATYEQWFHGKPELAILQMLGLFDRPAPQDEIAVLRAPPAIAGLTDALDGLPHGAWNEAVTALQDVGLLAAGSETLDAHPLVRQHFGEQLKREQPEAWREGHGRLYEHLKGKATASPCTAEEMEPLYTAVVHGCLAGMPEEAFRKIYRLRIAGENNQERTTEKLGAVDGEVAVLSAFFNPPWEAEPLVKGLLWRTQAHVLNAAGDALRAQGRLREAKPLLERGFAILRDDGARDASASAASLSRLFRLLGNLGEAERYAVQSVDLARERGNDSLAMLSETVLGAALHALGRLNDAAKHFENAELILKRLPPDAAVRGFRYDDLLLDLGDYPSVLERAGIALEVATKNAWPLRIAVSHRSLGQGHLSAARAEPDQAKHHLGKAKDYLDDAVNGLRRANHQEFIPLGLLARAALLTHTGAFADARHDLDEALALSTRCGFRLYEADAHLGFAHLHLAVGEPADARKHLGDTRTIIRQTGYRRRKKELAHLESLAKVPTNDEHDAPGNRVLDAAVAAAEVFGPRLVSVYALGSLAHGGFSPLVSDVDVAFILEDPLLPSDSAGMETVKRSVVGLGLPLAERLSIFWGSQASLRGAGAGGRFPPLDRLDLLQHGRLLAGRDERAGLLAPSHRDLVIGAADFALKSSLRQPESVQQILDPTLLVQQGIRPVTKRVLFPVRFLYTARTGEIGRNEDASADYVRLGGSASPLVAEALRWRDEPPSDGAALALLSVHLLPLYLEFLDDHARRMEEYGEAELATGLRAWSRELGGPG
jgi:tetratricopeptide (TPR) repeat protein